MDMPSLKAFLSVAKLASFSAAAEALHLTQPAVSKRISQLEQQLGVKLFDRVGRKVLLTESGTALYPRAQQLLLDMEDTRRCISSSCRNNASASAFRPCSMRLIAKLPIDSSVSGCSSPRTRRRISNAFRCIFSASA